MREDYPEMVDDPADQEGDDDTHEVPEDLLDLHVQLEQAGTTAEDFKAAFGGQE